MIKGKQYHTYTDSYARERESWFDDIPAHVAAYERAGKKIYQAAIGESGNKQNLPQAFVISAQRESKLRRSS